MDKFEVLISVNKHINSRKARFLQAFTMLNNDSSKDVDNEKGDMFEAITAKGQVMVFFMTKDSLLLQGFWQLRDNHETVKINLLSEIKKVDNKPFKMITDTYHNHVLDEGAIKFPEKLDAERIIVLAPYHISKLRAKALIYFISRKESAKSLLKIACNRHLSHKNS